MFELLQEADGAAPSRRFKVRVIQAGLSLNRNFYPDAALREAVALFRGVRVLVKADAEHLQSRGHDPRAIIGRLVDPVFVPGSGKDAGEIQAVLEAISPNDPMIVRLREAVQAEMADLFGLSIDARAQITEARGVRTVTKFVAVKSVDLIVEPGAGGRVLDVLEAAPTPASEEPAVLRTAIINQIKAARPQLLEGRVVESLTDADLEGLLTEALRPVPQTQTVPAVTSADIDAAVALVEARRIAGDRVRRSTLPAAAQDRVIAQLAGIGVVANLTEAAVDTAIQAEQAYLAPLMQAGRVAGLGLTAQITVGETRADKVRTMLEAHFDPAHQDHRHARSIRDIYVDITGDRNVTGLVRNCDRTAMREALDSASFAEVLGDAITRRMLADYRVQTQIDLWRKIVNVTRISDFRQQHRTRFGGYGDLPIVAESAAYQAVTSPTDEEATFAVSKRGGLESVTLEMIKNDDVGAVAKIPTRLSRAAKRTLSKFVFDFIRANPVVYDGKALFHVDHANLFTAALTAASYAAARLAMMRQAEAGSNEPLSVQPGYLLIPADLEEAAYNLFVRNTNNDKTFVQTLNPEIVPVWYWTDVNDWAVAADPLNIPSIEVGFLDGQEEPELLIQDNPTSGSMFTNDKLTWKIRHIYGGAVCDFRGLGKSIVP